MLTATETPEPIAVVGLGCRFPGGGSSPSKLWDLLSNPPDLTRSPPSSRFNIDGFYHENAEKCGATNAPSSYFLDEDISLFDNQFFGVTSKEAMSMDPQQRLLLETVYEAMEHAGLTISDLKGSETAVFVGLMISDWADIQRRDMNYALQHTATGATRAIVSNRVSYFYDWKGPSMTIDTACSSSLVAVHEAVRSLRTAECNVACAAGVNLLLGPDDYILLSNMHMVSPTGRSRMWDADADGYARGEGIAVLMLKRLSDAIADNDHIEAVIRETGVNSDGRTKGITMPSHLSQAKLIRDSYRRAGLDIKKSTDRPQFFEAHGTGTQAGDIQEATAIKSSFFSESEEAPSQKLIVGSIKTVIGHTEGAAGIAGVIKAILAMRRGKIPPNKHLERLNPSLEQFMEYLLVPRTETTWPQLSTGVPRRASVNSFGFGGTNAHAILELFDASIHHPLCKAENLGTRDSISVQADFRLPLLFSASSETTLLHTVQQYAKFLRDTPDIDLYNLAWTLQSHRSAFNFKISFSNTNRLDVIRQMEDICRESPGLGVKSQLVNVDRTPHILGVFTGQGAQWPRMGAELIQHSWLFRNSFEKLEKSLAELPEPPEWSLKEELLASEDNSHIKEAVISQPICTAVQVALVDLLQACGIKFQAVVGHSSGEIAAAYAAGYLSAHDAIRIAYYRGLYAYLAQGKDGARGGMLATGLGRASAIDLCSQERFRGRLVVAANNSPTSSTLSGDLNAVIEAQKEISAAGEFARLLQVDVAYHSPHMLHTTDSYMKALEACNITPLQPAKRDIWFSSTQSHHYDPPVNELSGTYWRENMVSTVLFTEAIRKAVETAGPFDACLEVGPHPALKGPVTQTLKDLLGHVYYSGVLYRGKDDTIALSDALAGLWVNTKTDTVSFDGLLTAMDHGPIPTQMVLELPTYPWQHDQQFWKESRWSKRYRLRERPHELLGSRIPNDIDQDLRWYNLLKPEEVPWLKDHRFGGQVLVPAAGYCAMAFEAAHALSDNAAIEMIELRQLDLENAIILKENSVGMEVICAVRPHTDHSENNTVFASFSCFAAPADGSLAFQRICSAVVVVRIGPPLSNVLPSRERQRANLRTFSLDRFYRMMSGTGLEYTGSFRGLQSAERRKHMVTATVHVPAEQSDVYYIHPITLDVTFQTLFAAYSAPGDEALWTSFLPRRIQNIKVNVGECQASSKAKADMLIDTDLTDLRYPSTTHGSSIIGDVQIYNELTGKMMVQVEGLEFLSFDAGYEKPDRQLIVSDVWRSDIAEQIQTPLSTPVDTERREFVDTYHRIARFYLSALLEQVSADQFQTSLTGMQDAASRWIEYTSRENPYWDSDTEMELNQIDIKKTHRQELETLKSFGRCLPLLVRYGTEALEDNIIEQITQHLYLLRDLECVRSHTTMFHLIEQIAHKHSNLRVLELGARDGELATHVLSVFGDGISEYVISECFNEDLKRLETTFAERSTNLRFQTLNTKQPLQEQYFVERSFDLVIISNRVGDTEVFLPYVRSLLRPGGYLILEVLSDKNVQSFFTRIADQVTKVALAEHGRDQGEGLSRSWHQNTPLKWDNLLRQSGFSGVDAIVHDFSEEAFRSNSVVLTQVLDERISILRQPFKYTSAKRDASHGLLIVGGTTLETFQFTESLCDLIGHRAGQITRIESFAKLRPKALKNFSALLYLEDSDDPFLKSLSSDSWENMKAVMLHVSSVLWVLRGARDGNPYHAGSLGLGRTIAAEAPRTCFQFLDLKSLVNAESYVAKSLLRLIYAEANNLRNDQTLLWKFEQELEYEGGIVRAPRLQPLYKINRRLNSFRRASTETLDLRKQKYCLTGTSRENTAEATILLPHTAELQFQAQRLSLEVSYSSLKPIFLTNEAAFLAVASDPNTNKRYIVVLDQNTYITTVPHYQAIEIQSQSSDTVCLYQAILQAISQRILSFAPKEGTTIVEEPGMALAEILTKIFTRAARKIVFITRDPAASNQETRKQNFIYIHHMASKKSILNGLPIDIALLIEFGPSPSKATHTLREVIPNVYTAHGTEVLFADQEALTFMPFAFPESLEQQLQSLAQAVHSPEIMYDFPDGLWTISPVSMISSNENLAQVLTIIDWASSQSVVSQVAPIEAASLFGPEKTYLLVGLTSELGLSICQWMIDNGARNLVICSRAPNVDKRWQQEMISKGANVRLERCDVTSKSQIMSLKTQVQNRPFPIGGIMHGAMIMKDAPFSSMATDMMRDVLRPKVEGIRYLDEAFQDDNLDFFIAFSSATAVVGNPGQANYNCGNQYMAGVIGNRRKRGLAGIAVGFGLIAGVGFVRKSNNQDDIEHFVGRQHIGSVSEADVHAVLSEAIVAGRPGEDGYSELIVGLEKVNLTDPMQQPSWRHNPRFTHLTYNTSTAEADIIKASATTAILKSKIDISTNIDEIAIALEDLFRDQLAITLQMPAAGIRLDVSLIELGIDSLVAAEIRSWFLISTGHDLSVLDILGGASTSELCRETAAAIFEGSKLNNQTYSDEFQPDSRPIESSAFYPGFSSMAAKTESFTESFTPSSNSTATSDWLLDGGSDDSSSFENQGLMSSAGSDPMALETDNDSVVQVTTFPAPSLESIEPLSYGQSRIWFPSQYTEDSSTYNCTTSYRLHGHLDVERLRKALWAVTQRHESFRTAFRVNSSTGEGMQHILPFSSFELETVNSANDSADVDAVFQRIAGHCFDLNAGSTFIAVVLIHTSEYATIVFGYHHLIMDGVSWQLTLQDIEQSYSNPDAKVPGPRQYRDFANNQRKAVLNEELRKQRDFWKSELVTPPKPLPLFPFAKVSARQVTTRYDTINLSFQPLDPTLVAKVKGVSQILKTTTFHVHLAVIQILLQRFLQIEDFCLGVLDASRMDKEYNKTIGFMANILPVRFQLRKDQIFTEIVTATRNKVYSALKHSAAPWEVILEDTSVPYTSGCPPLFQVLVNYRMGALKQKTIGDLALEFHNYTDARSPYDISFAIDETGTASTGYVSLSLPKYMFDDEGAQTIMDSYLHLLTAFTDDINQRVDSPSLYGGLQIEKWVSLGTGIKLPTKWPNTLSRRIEQVMTTKPQASAVKDSSGRSLTYELLSKRANSIAARLEPLVSQGARIAVLCEASADLVATLLAVMRLGAVYVPLDKKVPDERLQLIIKEAQPSVLIHDDSTATRAENIAASAEVIHLGSIAFNSTHIVQDRSLPDENAFFLFTSGSTGKPKGIQLTHSNYVHHVTAASEFLRLDEAVVLHPGSIAFDMSLAQIFYALANGGTVVMAGRRRDPAHLSSLMLQHRVTFTLTVPSDYTLMLDYNGSTLRQCTSWKTAASGGESFSLRLKEKFRQLKHPSLRVVNAYGPTESSVGSSMGDVDLTAQCDTVDIGKTLNNYSMYIVDKKGRPLPIGCSGELVLGGPAIAKGYVNNEIQTSQRFVPDRISPEALRREGWTLLYHTGDKAQMLDNGRFIYQGRIEGDTQVELNGVRIELEDVENTIIKHAAGDFTDVAISMRGETDHFLVAFAVFASGKRSLDSTAFRASFLSSLPLPSYMKPTRIEILDQLPLFSSGKLDRKALKALPLLGSGKAPEPDELESTEDKLRQIWTALLQRIGYTGEISKDTDFFQVGGNSLLLLRLQAEIRTTFAREVPLVKLFKLTKLDALAAHVDAQASQVALSQVDWDKETELPEILGDDRKIARSGPAITSGRITVALTGATGFLGQAILQLLLHDKRVEKIHCIAIRPRLNETKPRPAIFSHAKVKLHAGDLSQPSLGMSEEAIRAAFSHTHVIVHNGAEVSFLKDYESLRASNVTATKELTRLAPGVPLHFVSTGGVALFSGQRTWGEQSLAAYRPPLDGSYGYIASKWASEQYLEKMAAAAGGGGEVWIHRPSSITGKGVPELDVINNLLKHSRRMLAVPDLSSWGEGTIDLVTVERVAKDIVQQVLETGTAAGGGGRGVAKATLTGSSATSIRYKHHCGEQVVSLTQLAAFVGKTASGDGRPARVLPVDAWIEKATVGGLHELVAAYIRKVASRDVGEKHKPTYTRLLRK